ncbi:MAG TPA: membrane protein insertase YidC [Acidobacteriota bacterium]|nr:membrane protein insertase YidC [Acidobacteriota bacterium]
MEKRAIIAIALSVLVLFVFREIQDRRTAQLARLRPPVQRQTGQAPALPPVLPAAPAPAAERPVAEAPASAAIPGDTSATARSMVIEGALYRTVLDNRGALLTSWELKQYKSASGQPFEMIAATHDAETRPYPGSCILDDPSLTRVVNNEYYDVQVSGGGTGDKLTAPVSVTLQLRRGDLYVVKRYQFEKENYLVDLSETLEKGGRPLAGRLMLGQDIGPEQEHLIARSPQVEAVSSRGGKVERDGPPKDENEIRRVSGDIRWVGLDMQYFAIIAIPPRPMDGFDLQKRPVKTVGLDGKEVSRDLLKLTIPTLGQADYRIYLGPKDPRVLEAVGPANLTGVINYGMFSFLVIPLLTALKFIYQYVHNYGAAIILLTFLLTLLLFPIRLKQMLSMKKMAVVQPKIKEIQEKYKRYKKTDPKRAEMNQEIMAVYKAHNVNPLGGCLPLILQMPLLFAFYSLLANSIELRQAPFWAWMHDLSAKDPYYILPIIMGVTMLISQKMTPMAPGSDPTQAKMMMMMPVVFTFMFLNVSSGLILYFLCSNIFQIAFQKIAERWVRD